MQISWTRLPLLSRTWTATTWSPGSASLTRDHVSSSRLCWLSFTPTTTVRWSEPSLLLCSTSTRLFCSIFMVGVRSIRFLPVQRSFILLGLKFQGIYMPNFQSLLLLLNRQVVCIPSSLPTIPDLPDGRERERERTEREREREGCCLKEREGRRDHIYHHHRLPRNSQIVLLHYQAQFNITGALPFSHNALTSS